MATAKKIVLEQYKLLLELSAEEAEILLTILGHSNGLTSPLYHALYEAGVRNDKFRITQKEAHPISEDLLYYSVVRR